MKRLICIMLLSVVLPLTGCTAESTKIAQEASLRVQSVQDGVHNDMMNALSRENYEVAVLTATSATSKAQVVAAIKEFAKKRDKQLVWDRDHERANALKYVTVDAKLYSEQGIANYIGKRFSTGSKETIKAWDVANVTVNQKPKPTTQPAS